MNDFGVLAYTGSLSAGAFQASAFQAGEFQNTVTAQPFTVILSMPGEDLLGGQIVSNQYEIEYATSAITLSYGEEITILGAVFRCLQSHPVDDGVFTRTRLETYA